MASRRSAASRCAPLFIDPPGYARHRPEETLLYQLVEQHSPALRAAREAAGHPLPKHVQRAFEASLPFALRFLLARDSEVPRQEPDARCLSVVE